MVSALATPQELAARQTQEAAAFWAANQKGHAMIPPEIVDTLIATGETIAVHAIRDGSSKFGPTWFADVQVGDEFWTIAMSHNSVRDPLMLAAGNYIASFGPLPASLIGFTTALGKGWDFGPPLHTQIRLNGDTGADNVPVDLDTVPF